MTEAAIMGWRLALGSSFRFWAGPNGHHRVTPTAATAFSLERTVDYNVVACFGADAAIEDAVDEIGERRVPALIMLAGPALGVARRLVDAGWVPVRAVPFMHLQISPRKTTSHVQRLDLEGLVAYRHLIEGAFDVSPRLAQVALPDAAAVDSPNADADFAGWGLYSDGTMMSGVGTVTVDEHLCIWSMATAPGQQRRGFGAGLLDEVLNRCSSALVQSCLLIASPAGEALYRSMGFEVVEYWQVWSKPRWVLA